MYIVRYGVGDSTIQSTNGYLSTGKGFATFNVWWQHWALLGACYTRIYPKAISWDD
eukprot:UN06532